MYIYAIKDYIFTGFSATLGNLAEKVSRWKFIYATKDLVFGGFSTSLRNIAEH